MACPKPLVLAESVAWIESYCVLKRLGAGVAHSMAAKDVDAFLILEKLLAAEIAAQAQDAPTGADRRDYRAKSR